jgi:mono/diheme cytochrome c family protein
MTQSRFATFALTASAVALAGLIANAAAQAPATAAGAAPQFSRSHADLGAYLVRTMGCNDCHTPWKMGPKGPEMDMTRALTGHPQDMVMPPPPTMPAGPWIGSISATNTAWAGPWGVSFTANLTPDKETGLGDWTEEQFIATMRTGKHQGKGRPVLPPMPYFMVGALTDPEIKALWAYLQSLPPVRNRVPQPIDPPEGSQQ